MDETQTTTQTETQEYTLLEQAGDFLEQIEWDIFFEYENINEKIVILRGWIQEMRFLRFGAHNSSDPLQNALSGKILVLQPSRDISTSRLLKDSEPFYPFVEYKAMLLIQMIRECADWEGLEILISSKAPEFQRFLANGNPDLQDVRKWGRVLFNYLLQRYIIMRSYFFLKDILNSRDIGELECILRRDKDFEAAIRKPASEQAERSVSPRFAENRYVDPYEVSESPLGVDYLARLWLEKESIVRRKAESTTVN